MLKAVGHIRAGPKIPYSTSILCLLDADESPSPTCPPAYSPNRGPRVWTHDPESLFTNYTHEISPINETRLVASTWRFRVVVTSIITVLRTQFSCSYVELVRLYAVFQQNENHVTSAYLTRVRTHRTHTLHQPQAYILRAENRPHSNPKHTFHQPSPSLLEAKAFKPSFFQP